MIRHVTFGYFISVMSSCTDYAEIATIKMRYLPASRVKLVEIGKGENDAFERFIEVLVPEHTSPLACHILLSTEPGEDAYDRQPGRLNVPSLPVIHVRRVDVRQVGVVVDYLQHVHVSLMSCSCHHETLISTNCRYAYVSYHTIPCSLVTI